MQPLVLVLNSGSSSIKFSVVEPATGHYYLEGMVDNIGSTPTELSYKDSGDKQKKLLAKNDYQHAMHAIIELLNQNKNITQHLIAVGHRVVHGGEAFKHSTIIDETVLSTIRLCNRLAPLHNPANILGIEFATEAFSHLPQVAVFDTAFHQTMPAHAFIYPIPYELYKNNCVRRYGFHGTSHAYVTRKAAEILEKPIEQLALLSAHLGNGCSATAVLNGKSVDTSMGLTPLEGLVMGTRSGDVDPSLHAYLADELGYDVHRTTQLLNRESGLLGISNISHDMRTLISHSEKGDEQASLAINIFCYRLSKYLAALAVPLGKIDALIFTGGIGENAAFIREKVLTWLRIFNFECDTEQNAVHGKNANGIITKTNSTPIAMVVNTKEDLMIAQDAIDLVGTAL